MRSARVIVIGSINVDNTISCPRLPVPGETLLALGQEFGMGGKGANQAVAAARLGAHVHLLGQVGGDEQGKWAADDLRGEKVHIEAVGTDPLLPTGQALVLRETAGANSIIVLPGANSTIGTEFVSSALISLAVTSADVILASAEIPEPAIEAAAAIAGRTGTRLLYNTAPFRPLARWIGQMRPILILNAVEAEQATGLTSPAAALNSLRELSRLAIITLGPAGALLSGDDVPVTSIPAPRVDAVDTVGAGDAFCGAMAWGLCKGLDPVEAAKKAVLAGTFAVTKSGARGALASPNDLDSTATWRTA